MNQRTDTHDLAESRVFVRWFFVAIAASVLGFAAGTVSLGGYGMAYARALHISYRVLMPASFCFATIWLSAFVFALVRYHRRGLWFLVCAPLALFWPIVAALLLHAVATCVAVHLSDSIACFP